MSEGGIEALRALAEQCRRLASGVSTPGVAASLLTMAADYDLQADKAAAADAPPNPAGAATG